MKKKIWKIFFVAALWLLSIVLVAQCAIHETHRRGLCGEARADATRAFSDSHFPNPYFNTPSRGFESTFKGGFTDR